MKFNYQARTKEGQVQAGVVEAASKEAALNVLQNYGVYVTFLEEVKLPIYARKIEIFKGVSVKEKVIFTRQLAILFKASVPVVESLQTLASQTKKRNFKEIIEDIGEKIEGGTPLSQALAAHPDIFSPFFIGMVKSGEASGKLSEVLEYLADHMEREYNFRTKMIMAMVYPFFVLFVFVAVIILMITFVIPQLSQVLKETGQQLPWITQRVIGLSDFVRAKGQVIIFLILGFIFIVFRIVKSKEGKEFIDKKAVEIPLIGSFLKKVYLSRLAENLSTLIASGLPIIQAFEVTGDVLGSELYKAVVEEIKEGVKRGEAISLIISKHPDLFPPLFVQMVVVGERTGKLDAALMNVVSFYQKDVERALDTLVSLLEPIMIIGLGLAVLGLMGSVMLPIYQIGLQ